MKRTSIAAAATSLLVLSACGGGDDPAPESSEETSESTTEPTTAETPEEDAATLVDQSLQALKEEGQASIAGDLEGVGRLDFDITDAGLTGTVTPVELAGDDGQALPLDVVVLEDAGYMKAGAEFWASQGVPKNDVQTYSDQWIEVPPDNQLLSVSDTFTIDALVEQFGEVPEAATVEVSELDGEPVYVIADPDGGSFTMSAESKLPVEIQSDSGESSGALTISYDDITTAEAPADALTLEELQAQAR
jgi:hypothetical protein